MSRFCRSIAGISLLVAGVVSSLLGQGQPDPEKVMAAQKDAMKKLSMMDGVWRGTAWTIMRGGEKHTVTQTERIGPFLDGSVKVIEGRGYEPDGSTSFNAFAIISYDPAKSAYSMRSYAQGRSGDFVFTPTAHGYYWEIPAGPMTIRYTATIKGGSWLEVGDRMMPDGTSIRFFEMNLTRLGDGGWPADGSVAPK